MKISTHNGQGFVELVDYMGDDTSIVKAARVSILQGSKGPEKDAKLIKFLLRERHTSPFEHCTLTFSLDVPLFVARQHMRHRTWSFNEVSRRYTSEDLRLWIPAEYRAQAKRNLQCSDGLIADVDMPMAIRAFEDACAQAVAAYNTLLDLGVAREQARAVLPQSMMCRYFGTVNLHNLFHFFGLRLHSHAQPEIEEVAKAMFDIAKELYPEAVGAWYALRRQPQIEESEELKARIMELKIQMSNAQMEEFCS